MLTHKDQTLSTVTQYSCSDWCNPIYKLGGGNRSRSVNYSVLYAYFKKLRKFTQLIL